MITYHPPPAGAERLLTQFYAFVSPGGTLRLPAMMPQLQVHLQGGTIYRTAAGLTFECQGPTLVGATSGFVDMEMPAGAALIGVGLLAQGWRALTNLPADVMTDRVAPATIMWSCGDLERLHAHVREGDLPSAVSALRAFVLPRVIDGARSDPRLRIIDHWLERQGKPSVDQLTRDLGLSLRHVERLVRRSYGAAPRLLELKYRTLRVAHEMAVRPDAVQHDADFYDQSHLIQNFGRFVGVTPARFEREGRHLARELLAARWRAGARSRLALWG